MVRSSSIVGLISSTKNPKVGVAGVWLMGGTRVRSCTVERVGPLLFSSIGFLEQEESSYALGGDGEKVFLLE